ncbi:DUF1844 domain-containing protein [Acidipila rosea]|uniref:Uncharacterized protein DUF1844 n=1 Tax=Acidipila rosea TaxID=768535 RepID=A0A4V2PVB1_9BACT|nr:DUF1844 domain-containing protein [Acidipila rosea]TCK73711.1 uncharacterized protein DUF1844 [Acidipila rosea]
MSEKPSSFTVTDRRKFTLEGELRDESASEPVEQQVIAAPEEKKPSNVVSMPAPPAVAEPESESESEFDLEEHQGPSEEQSAEQHAAYQQSSRDLDTMLRAANPGMAAPGVVSFDHVIQSIYLSAVMALGAGAEPGQKPRIDIMGARQSIDMLAVLQEKTKGNLTSKEQTLLQGALFELRMMFLEITNAIAQSAQRQPPPVK